MTKLEFLWIANNRLEQISNSGSPLGLKYLHLENNKLIDLNLDYFKNTLKRIYLDFNRFNAASTKYMPHKTNNLENLESLSMNYNNLNGASIVADMKNLRILYMEGNNLEHVPTFHPNNQKTGFRLNLR